MGVTVQPGIVTVPGTENASQGAYTCYAATATDVTLDPAHASLPRIDLIVARVQDSQYSGAANTWTLEKVTGTAASSPVAPTAPNNSITLAQISVAAAATQILNASITDKRIFSSTGVTVCTSTTRPSPAISGMVIVQTDDVANRIMVYNGTTWVNPAAPGWIDYTPQAYQNMATTPASVSRTIVYARYQLVGKTCDVAFNVTINAVTTGGVGLQMPFTAQQRFFAAGALVLGGGGTLPTDQAGTARFLPSPHLDKIVVHAASGGFRDTGASGQSLFGALRYEVA